MTNAGRHIRSETKQNSLWVRLILLPRNKSQGLKQQSTHRSQILRIVLPENAIYYNETLPSTMYLLVDAFLR